VEADEVNHTGKPFVRYEDRFSAIDVLSLVEPTVGLVAGNTATALLDGQSTTSCVYVATPKPWGDSKELRPMSTDLKDAPVRLPKWLLLCSMVGLSKPRAEAKSGTESNGSNSLRQ
jgi:hypothetical protein